MLALKNLYLLDYRNWAQDARDKDQKEVADLLASAAQLTGTISDQFREADGKVHLRSQ